MIHITSLDDGLERFKALGSDIRIQILKILLENNQMSMNQIANELNISNGALTGHIKKLEECGLISTSNDSSGHGNQKLCSLIQDRILVEIEKPIDDVPDKERKRWFKLNATTRENLPLEILLFAILDNPKYASENVQSVSFISLLNDENSIGLVFALTTTGLIDKLEQMQQQFKNFLTYSDDAGVRELQFKVKPNKWDILQQYYAK